MPGGALLMVRPSIATLTPLAALLRWNSNANCSSGRRRRGWPLVVNWAGLDEHVRRPVGPPSHNRHVGLCQLTWASCQLATVNMAVRC